jgi:hypothetical protein
MPSYDAYIGFRPTRSDEYLGFSTPGGCGDVSCKTADIRAAEVIQIALKAFNYHPAKSNVMIL